MYLDSPDNPITVLANRIEGARFVLNTYPDAREGGGTFIPPTLTEEAAESKAKRWIVSGPFRRPQDEQRATFDGTAPAIASTVWGR